MKESKPASLKKRCFYIGDRDYEALKTEFSSSSASSFSRFCVHKLLGKPIIFNVRQQSLDELVVAMMSLSEKLDGLLSIQQVMTAELKRTTHIGLRGNWLQANEKNTEQLIRLNDQTQTLLEQIGAQWMQKLTSIKG